MILKKIQLNNFRSHKNAVFEFEHGVNVICGPNGAGKTNILEAIHFLATAKSHRTSNERELVRHAEDTHPLARITESSRFELGQASSESVSNLESSLIAECPAGSRGVCKALARAEFIARGRDNEIEGRIAHTGKKQFKKNDVAVRKTSDLMGFLSVVMFSPDDLAIIKGAPSQRRKMLDLAICQMSKKYFHAVSSYGRVLSQKNKLLKEIDAPDERLEVWNEQLAVLGVQINTARAEYIEKLGATADEKFEEIMGLSFKVEYIPNGEGFMGDADDLLKLIKRNQKKELKQHLSLVGPHRDDFRILVSGVDARNFASQGQQRSAVIAMKMAQVEMLKERLGESPVLLLDDVMSELDKKRQAQILVPNSGAQVIITTTKPPKSGRVILL